MGRQFTDRLHGIGRMNATASIKNAPLHAPNIGSPAWAVQVFMQQLGRWRPTMRSTLAFLAGATLVMIFLEIFDLPGGVLPAIPVLTMPLVPHSARLLMHRIVVVCLTLVLSFLLMTIFQEQPWFLIGIAMVVVYFGLFLVARGLDVLSYLIAVAMPVLLAWNAANGVDLQPA
ncbi:MAG: hypothetical protein MK085_09635, partial [Phycisphaerales bacterium]|nr:hypothetical protein [Phycisphaerales bacterium]